MRIFLSAILAICFIALAIHFQPKAKDNLVDEFGVVTHVQDGDSFELLLNGKKQIVRVFGIDAPEKGQPYAGKSKKFLTDLIEDKNVQLQIIEKDRYGRLISNVQLMDGRDVGAMLAKDGYAWWYRRYAPYRSSLKVAENSARERRVGLWAEKNPTPPWDWRKSK